MDLAVQYRPREFKDVVGQEAITKILEAQIENNDIKHSYIFAGPSGDGKTTTARIFANELNDGKGGIIEIDGASNNGVDNIRDLRDSCQFKPIGSRYKVYIIDECHMLSIGAFNGLLKTLEEPPEHCVFILCTTDPQKIPATIISRCQRFDFRRISTELIADRLKYIVENENITMTLNHTETEEDIKAILVDNDVYNYIARLSNGGMRRAITMLETCINYPGVLSVEVASNILGVASDDVVYELYKAVARNQQEDKIIEIIDRESSKGADLKLLFKSLVEMSVRICKMWVMGTKEAGEFTLRQREEIDDEFVNWGINDHLKVLDALLEVQQRIKYETDIKTLLIGELITLWLGKKR